MNSPCTVIICRTCDFVLADETSEFIVVEKYIEKIVEVVSSYYYENSSKLKIGNSCIVFSMKS